MPQRLKKGVFVFQFLSPSSVFYNEPNTVVRFNSSVHNVGPKLQRRLEKLIMHYKIGFIRMLFSAEVIYFRHYFNSKKNGKRRLISFIICCEDYPYESRVHLQLRITPNFDKIIFVSVLLVNYSQQTSNFIANYLSTALREPLSFFDFYQHYIFQYPRTAFLEYLIMPCASFAFERPIDFNMFCSI